MHTTLKQQRATSPVTLVDAPEQMTTTFWQFVKAVPRQTVKFARFMIKFAHKFTKFMLEPFIKFFSRPVTLYRLSHILWRVIKRTTDILVSLISLLGLSPIFIAIAVAIKLDDGGPVFFRQVRTGKNGKAFKILKFRTCAIDNNVLDTSGEDQYTRVGKFLRRTSIDELPQLINILKGEMSFIGPRPWITDYWDNMTENQRQRSTVRPGLTGLAQVKGRNALTIFDKIGYDLEYVDHYSPLEDFRVFALTFKAIFSEDESTAVNAGKATIHSELDQLKMQKTGH